MMACACPLLSAVAAAPSDWTQRGPGPALNGQVEGMGAQQNPVAGAIHTVLAHPTDPNILYAGAVNGGIWKTTNAAGGNPTWTPLTDFKESLSIGAMAFDPTDATRGTIIAGIGRYSSLSRRGGARIGLLRTMDGGSTWSVLDGGMVGKNISGIASRGNTIIAAVNVADSFTYGNIGIFRSTDGGASFARISSGDPNSLGTNGLPGGRAWDMVEDPTNSAVLYVAIRDAAANNGVYKSVDTGATWTRVSDATMQTHNTDTGSFSTVNIEMAVGSSGEVYAAFMASNGRLSGLFRSGNGGANWVQLDTPSTNENGSNIGLQPREKDYDVAGGQGAIHFSILADPTNPNVVYLGGDRQPGPGEGPTSWPNSIGASNYTGRLFKVDASLPTGSQSRALTHNPSTLSNSAPHADSREMTFDAAGNIIEVDDGGIYKRTNPQGTSGDWFSLNNNIQVAEIHSLDYDRNTNTITGGTQDIGTIEERIGQGSVWRTVNQGDGGQVAIFDGVDGESVRYTSSQFLGGFRRRVIDSNGNTLSQTFPSLLVGGQSLGTVDNTIQFYGPVAVNRINGNLLIGTSSVYESTDGGTNLASLGSLSRSVAAIEAGGYSGGIANPDVLYVAARSGNSLPEAVLRRTAAGGSLVELTAYAAMAGSSNPVDLVMDDLEWANLFVADPDQVFGSADAGDTFTDITGNLTDDNLHTLEFVTVQFDTNGEPGFEFDFGVLLAGGDDGVFYALDDAFGTWLELGANTLPNAPVLDLIYDPYDDILVAGLQGRGAWTFEGFAASLVPEPGGLLVVLGAGVLMLRRRVPAR